MMFLYLGRRHSDSKEVIHKTLDAVEFYSQNSILRGSMNMVHSKTT